ncbi:hypothetical protein [Kitasatospora sp. NPDC093806]|uniref:hypothetical protein n=1 Tax=Kitasatospora sp. NPDC093806 TaxID=3155075 RepID=UPI003435807B
MNLAEIRGPWLLGETGVVVVAATVLLALTVTCAVAAVRGRGYSAGARAALGLGAVAALAGAVVLTMVRADGRFVGALDVVLPYLMAAGGVGWAVRLARHGD